MRYLVVLLVVSCAPPAPVPEACVELNPRTVEIRFQERDGRGSNKLAVPGTVTRAENVEMIRPGTYQRRRGTDAVETVSGAKELAAYSGGLVTLSDTQLKQRIGGAFTLPAASSLRWQAVTATRSIESGADQICHSHVRAADGRDWHVWEAYENGQHRVKYSVVDPTTGAHVVHDAQITAPGSRPAILAIGTDILVFYVKGGETNNSGSNASLMVRKIAQASPASVGSETTVENAALKRPANNDHFASFAYDVIANGSTAVIASRVLSGSDTVTRVRTWNVSTMASIASVDEAGGIVTVGHDVIAFLSWDFSDSKYYLGVGYVDNSTGVRTLLLQRVGTDLASVTNTTLKTESGNISTKPGWKNVTGFVDDARQAHVLADIVNHAGAADSSAAMKWYYYATRTEGGSVAALSRPGFGLASRPWLTGSDRYILLSHTSYAQPTYFVADPTTGTVCGRVFGGFAGLVDNENAPFAAAAEDGSFAERRSKLPSPQMVGSTATIAVQKLQQAPQSVISSAYYGGVSRGAWTVSLTLWTAGGEYQPVPASDVLLIPGGAPREFDGATLAESGFHLFPEAPPAEATNNLPSQYTGNRQDSWDIGQVIVNGGMANGTYFAQLVWEWTDSRGRRKQSAPSFPFSFTVAGGAGGKAVRVLNPPTARTGTRLVLYRTAVNAGVTATYHRAAQIFVTPLSEGGNLYTSISISAPDASIANNEQLYTLGETVLDNAPAFAMRQAKPWRDRVVFLLEENRRAFGWSKLVKPDLGLEWSDSFVFEIADEFGDFTAIAPLGSSFLLFKRDAVYWMSDNGPDDTGAGQFSDPRRLEGFPGTTISRSVVSTSMGVMYQAPDNVIWLITPSLERVPIGEACADINLTVVGAIESLDKRQVRFHTASTTLVYDTQHSRLLQRPIWTTFPGQAALAAVVFNGVAHYLSTGAVVRKDSTAWDEAGTSYQAVLELSWLSLGQLAGYMRTWGGQLVGEALGAHTVSAVLTADFGSTTVTKSVASAVLLAALGYRVEFPVPMSLQQRTALRLRLQDDSPSTAGALWEGLNLHCGFASGRQPRLPNKHQMT